MAIDLKQYPWIGAFEKTMRETIMKPGSRSAEVNEKLAASFEIGDPIYEIGFVYDSLCLPVDGGVFGVSYWTQPATDSLGLRHPGIVIGQRFDSLGLPYFEDAEVLKERIRNARDIRLAVLRRRRSAERANSKRS